MADHGHGLEGGWAAWWSHGILRVILAAVVVCAVATIAAVVALWPDGSGRQEAQAQASRFGLASQRLAATVEEVDDAPCSYQGTAETPMTCRSVTVLLESGPNSGMLVALPEFDLAQAGIGAEVQVGDRLVVGHEPTTDFYFYADRDRRAPLGWLALVFAVVVVALGRKRGALALLAMALTVVVLVGFVAPAVLDGHDPLTVCLVAASLIAFVSLYLTHGFNPTTTVALAGTLGALVLTLAVSAVAFGAMRFTGLATEEGLTLPLVADINLVGLLLGGAMIGALGALDDVTVTQVATVAELKRRRPDLGTAELITSGIRVGREHIASTVNTLLLAYAGAGMPLLLLFAVADQPWAMVANSEALAIEIARTLCGSIGLVAATPLTTILAAVLVSRGLPEPVEPHHHATPTPVPTAPRPTSPAPAPPTQPVATPRPEPTWDDFGPRDQDPGF